MKSRALLVSLIAFFVTPAVLAAPAAGAEGPSISNIVMLAGFLLIFYFMLIRPQSKRAKQHQSLINNLAKDDEVVMNGGLLGKVSKIGDQFLVIAIADGIEVKVQRQAIASSLPKGTLKSI